MSWRRFFRRKRADTELAHVLTVAHRRLEAEYDAQVAAQRTLHASPVKGR